MANINDVRSAHMLATAQIVASINSKGEITDLPELIEKVARALYRATDPLKASYDGPPKSAG